MLKQQFITAYLHSFVTEKRYVCTISLLINDKLQQLREITDEGKPQ